MSHHCERKNRHSRDHCRKSRKRHCKKIKKVDKLCVNKANICKLDVKKLNVERTCEPTPISKPTTITKSGCYCLTKDICGTIVIAADNVSLDLNCHEIDAKGGNYAIFTEGRTGITIKNGSVVNSAAAGINIIACESVEVSNVTFRNHADRSLSIQAESVGPAPTFPVTNPSQVILVAHCDISQGNRAMLIKGCNEVRVENCDVYDNVNTIPNAVVCFEHCNDVVLQEVFVNNNTKAVPGQGQGPLGILGPETAVWLVQASNNVQLKNCMTNHNFSENGMSSLLLLGADLGAIPPFVFTGLSSGVIIEGHQSNSNTNTTGTLGAMTIGFVPNPVIRDCQTNGNVTTNASGGTTFGTQDFLIGLGVARSPGAYIKNHQSNENVSKGSSTLGIIVADFADGAVIEDCQCNDNGDLVESTFLVGIDLSFGLTATPSNGCIVRRCQANGNKARSISTGFLLNWNNALVEGCQANCNISTGDPNPVNNIALGLAAGFAISFDNSSVTLTSCEASDNQCTKSFAAGITGTGFPPIDPNGFLWPPPHNVVVQDCLTNGNSSTDDVGYGVRLNGATASEVVDCTAIANAVGFFNNIGAPFNSFFGNRAENNSIDDYQNIPAGNTVVFDKATATFVPTPPNRWSNVRIFPS